MNVFWTICMLCFLIKFTISKFKQPNPEKYRTALHVAMLERNLIEFENDNLTVIDDWYPKGTLILLDLGYDESDGKIDDSYPKSTYPVLLDLGYYESDGKIDDWYTKGTPILLDLGYDEIDGKIDDWYPKSTYPILLDLGYDESDGKIDDWYTKGTPILLDLGYDEIDGKIDDWYPKSTYPILLDLGYYESDGKIDDWYPNGRYPILLDLCYDENDGKIDDWYPKGTNHYIVISKRYIKSIRHVNRSHIPLLQEMEDVGIWVARSFRSRRRYLVGYHAEPFLDRLHLHVVSEELRGRGLKNKEQYNSFTTPFFLKSKDVIESLRINGSINFPSTEQCKKWLKQSLHCVQCGYQPKSMKDYKNKHVAYHDFDTWDPPCNVSEVPTGVWEAQPWTFFEDWDSITATPE